ncbi:MAG: toll/interleukin-1 receptor domain-containing protein [Anaerolineae bacterium]|nr:toll/interleukin-1 receptor domain-containing protein [Anaerolineae bacterium]
MKVFVCHAPSDSHTASKLALDLLKRGIDVWVDQPPPPGVQVDMRRYAQDVRDAIGAADAFVLLLSPTAIIAPDVLGQIDHAIHTGQRIIRAQRQTTLLTKALRDKLDSAAEIDISRANYDAGLVELLNMLGFSETIVNPILSTLEIDQWLPGLWQGEFLNVVSDVDGTAEYLFEADGGMQGEISSLHQGVKVDMSVRGTWQFLSGNLVIQGISQIRMDIEDADLPQNMTYVLSLHIVDVQPGLIRADTGAGDRVILRKVGSG